MTVAVDTAPSAVRGHPAGGALLAPFRLRPIPRWLGWGTILLLILAEWGLFRQFALREVVWSYPAYFDQLAYLEQSYQTYERILEHGLFKGLAEGAGLKFGHLPMNAAGATLHLQAAFLYLMAGPSRLSAISLNFIHFAIFQLALVATVRWLSGGWSAAFLALGLLLTTTTAFFYAGGLFDFRLDFIAFCLFGIFLCLVVRSRVFADPRWSALAGLGAVVLGTFRFITLAYLLGIFAVFIGLLLVEAWLSRRNAVVRQIVVKRLVGVGIACAVVAVLTGPVLWHHRQAIRGYYYMGHVATHEKEMRSAQAGTTTLSSDLKYYPVSLVRDHAGYRFLELSAFVLLAGAGVAIARRFKTTSDAPSVGNASSADPGAGIIFLGLCIVVPLGVLTLDTAKSEIVAGFVVAPLVWVVLLAGLRLFGVIGDRTVPGFVRYTLAATALVAMYVGAMNQFANYCRRTWVSENRPEIEKLLEMYDQMVDDCLMLGWTSPVIASDGIDDYLYHKILTIRAYERTGVLLNAGKSVGQLDKYDESELYRRLGRSDFALLTNASEVEPPSPFPFVEQMRRLHPQVLYWCQHNMVELRDLQLGAPFSRRILLFIRPDAKVQAARDGWVTSDGLVVSALASMLRGRPVIELSGHADLRPLGKVPNVTARVMLVDGGAIEAPAAIHWVDYSYTIHIELNPRQLPESGIVQVRVTFDRFFVPSRLGTSADTRKLVMQTPSEVHLRPLARE